MVKKWNLFWTVLTVWLVILSEGAFSQVDSTDLNAKWNAGFIELVDNSVRKGFIQYIDGVRLIKFKTYLNEPEELSFHEKRILAMEYFDAAMSKNRRFYTLNIREEDSGFTGAVLFEIVMEMKAFAVVSRRYIGQQSTRKRRSSESKRLRDFKESYNKFERIYIVDHGGKVELLSTVAVTEKEKSKPVARPVEPFLDQAVLAKYTGSKWRTVKTYVKEERLHLKKKPDLLKALAYYQQLEQAE
jgi:hypothetical protein